MSIVQHSQNPFATIRDLLSDARHILVVSHARPDGDALGSVLAAARWLINEGHEVTAWNEDGLPEKFSYLPDAALLTKPFEEPCTFDAVLVLDTATKIRLGNNLLTKIKTTRWVAIDHHVSNERFGDFNWIEPTAPATGQMLAEGFFSQGITVTPEMATNLYVAISTDTGSFQYSNTSARTLEITAMLIQRGVAVGELSQAMYASQPRRRFELLKHALAHAKFSSHDRVASFALTLHDAHALNVIPEDTEGIIDHLRSVEGVVGAIFFEELPKGMVRLSVRSKNEKFDAAAFCQHYGGGGHHMAAGARILGDLQAIEQKVLASIAETLDAVSL